MFNVSLEKSKSLLKILGTTSGKVHPNSLGLSGKVGVT